MICFLVIVSLDRTSFAKIGIRIYSSKYVVRLYDAIAGD